MTAELLVMRCTASRNEPPTEKRCLVSVDAGGSLIKTKDSALQLMKHSSVFFSFFLVLSPTKPVCAREQANVGGKNRGRKLTGEKMIVGDCRFI